VSSLLVLEEVIPSVKPSVVALATQDWAFVDLRPMDFAFVALKAAFVTENFPIARCMVAGVGTNVFVLMSPSACKYECFDISKGDLLQRRLRREQLLFRTPKNMASKRCISIRRSWLSSLGIVLTHLDNITHVGRHPRINRCLESGFCSQWMFSDYFTWPRLCRLQASHC
jgi:hypothetical protein